jgi:hypothetical protein
LSSIAASIVVPDSVRDPLGYGRSADLFAKHYRYAGPIGAAKDVKAGKELIARVTVTGTLFARLSPL